MADPTPGGESLLFLTDENLRKGIEAMFFAYRGFTADPDRILETMDYGRAHHRAVHFIHRSPGTTVGNLLAWQAPGYESLIVARVLTGLAHGVFFSIGSTLATGLVPKEKAAGAVAVRGRGNLDLGVEPLEAFSKRIAQDISSKA